MIEKRAYNFYEFYLILPMLISLFLGGRGGRETIHIIPQALDFWEEYMRKLKYSPNLQTVPITLVTMPY